MEGTYDLLVCIKKKQLKEHIAELRAESTCILEKRGFPKVKLIYPYAESVALNFSSL